MKFFRLVYAQYSDGSKSQWIAFIIGGKLVHNTYLTRKQADRLKKNLKTDGTETDESGAKHTYYASKND